MNLRHAQQIELTLPVEAIRNHNDQEIPIVIGCYKICSSPPENRKRSRYFGHLHTARLQIRKSRADRTETLSSPRVDKERYPETPASHQASDGGTLRTGLVRACCYRALHERETAAIRDQHSGFTSLGFSLADTFCCAQTHESCRSNSHLKD